MHKQFKSVSLMTLLMALPSGAMMAANVPSEVATVQQQKSTVAKGTVKDANGEPLIGAFVIVKGTTNGAAVDTEGNFTIKGVKVGQTLRISYYWLRRSRSEVGRSSAQYRTQRVGSSHERSGCHWLRCGQEK